MSEVSETVEITNQRGLHARASAKFVTFVSRLPETVSVEVEKGGSRVNGTSIMGLMMLGAAKGDSRKMMAVTALKAAMNSRAAVRRNSTVGNTLRNPPKACGRPAGRRDRKSVP